MTTTTPLDKQTIEVLGHRMAYHERGTGFILPTLYQILPRQGIDPMQ